MVSPPGRGLRIGIVTDGLEESVQSGRVSIANGGVGVYIHQLVRTLQAIDTSHLYFLIRHGRGRLDIYRQGGARNVFLSVGGPARWLGWPEVLHARLADRLHLDLLHYPNQFGGALLPRRIKRILTLHDLTPLLMPHCHPWRSVLWYRARLGPCIRRADHVIVDAESTRHDLVARRLVDPTKVSVVPLGVAEMFRPLRTPDFARRYRDLPERYILTVGVLEPRKNHACLVRALDLLHRGGERIGLVIIGRDGWHWHDPLADPAVTHLRSWVRVYRNVSDADLAELYGRAEVFAYPSLYEGFGLPIVEAMACGTPVVASNRSSLPEVAGSAALLADPTDVADFTAKLRAVLQNPSLRQRLISDGQLRARELSWRRTAERTLAIYTEVCGL